MLMMYPIDPKINATVLINESEMAELRKVTEIAKYKGILYFINAVIDDGKILDL